MEAISFEARIQELILQEFKDATSSAIRIAVQSAATQQDAVYFARLSLEARGQGPVPTLRVVHVSNNETEARMIAKVWVNKLVSDFIV